MLSLNDLIILKQLILTSALAGAVGYERERHGRAAGLRTHILVGLGACLVMQTANYLMSSLSGKVVVDPTRMGAQVISGIGFLGAGTIVRFRASVRGLTTAASLWAVAGLGLAVGSGFVHGAIMATAIVLLCLFGLGRVERLMRKDWYQLLVVESRASGEDLAEIRSVLSEHEVEIRDLDIKRSEQAEYSSVELNVKLLSDRDREEIVADLLRLKSTRRAHWA
jgi:putative Mg2+ transporter-C (MgtC) family protein